MAYEIGIKDLKLVRLIAEDGSLTAAARRMHVSQPAASQRLANLQQRLDVELFVRKDGLMRPTPIGDRLIAAAGSVANELESASSDIRTLIEGRTNRLRVTTQCYTCYRWLPFVISDMHALYPELTVDVIPEATDNPYDALSNDRIDIAVISNPQSDSLFADQTLFSDELYAVMSSDNPLATRTFLTPANFSSQTLVLYTGDKHAILEEILHPVGVSPARVVQVRITEAIVELARSGQGIAVLSGWAFSDLDNKGGLTPVRITKGGFKRTWRAVVGENCNEEHVASFVQSVRNVGEAMRFQAWRKKLQAGSKLSAGRNVRRAS